jgi:glycerophosphoryl diester phosphodiesterase
VNLRRADGGYFRFGHRGAAALAPENSLAAIEAALAAGVDGVELDVVRVGGRLLVAHSARPRPHDPPALDDALAFVRERSPTALVQLDLKRRGVEEEVANALRRHALLERAIVSSAFADALRAVRRVEPRLATGLGYPFDRTGLANRYLPERAVRAALAMMRGGLPARIGRLVRTAEADAAVLHHLVLSPATVSRCRALGVAVFAWTVNDARSLERVLALGVDGVISDDPAVFASR